MTTTEYFLTEADIGFTFPEVDGYMLSLIRSRGPHPKLHEMNWEQRYFRLRELKAPRDLYCIDGVNFGRVPLQIGGALFFAINTCIRFFGALTLAAVPVGSEWEIVLSDIYVAPRPSLHPSRSWGYAPNGMFGVVPGYRLPPRRQLALAAPPLMIAPPVTEKIEEA